MDVAVRVDTWYVAIVPLVYRDRDRQICVMWADAFRYDYMFYHKEKLFSSNFLSV